MARPNPEEICAAIKTVLESAANCGTVRSDAWAGLKPEDAASFVYDDATSQINGWVVEVGPELPPVMTGRVEEQVCSFLVTALLAFNEGEGGSESYAYWGVKIQAARAALQASRRLGFTAPNDVQHRGLYAAEGMTRLFIPGVLHVHYGPMQLDVVIREC